MADTVGPTHARLRHDKFQNVFMGLLVDDTFYEPIERHVPNDRYRSKVQSMLPAYWRLLPGPFWTQANPPSAALPIQGWKIHLSGTLVTAAEVLDRAVPALVQADAPFKFTSDNFILKLLTSKAWDRGGSGKFMTVYPRDQLHFQQLLESLSAALAGLSGPYILSDRRFGEQGIVYYRYGGVRGHSRQDLDGRRTMLLLTPDLAEVPDQRRPFFTLPPWVSDPHPAPAPEAAGPTPLGGRYVVERALKFSNTGGVYQARDLRTDAVVLIKEARPFTAVDEHGNDATALLRKEARLLTLLADSGVAPQCLEVFEEWEHTYLVQTFIEGNPLQRRDAKRNPLSRVTGAEDSAGWFAELRTLSLHLARALRAVHDRGVVFGDLSLGNVMLVNDQSLELKLIDFEGAHQPGVDPPVQILTLGFASAARTQRSAPVVADDLYALGACMLALIWPIGMLATLHPVGVRATLDAIAADTGLPDAFVRLIADLMHPDDGRRPDLDQAEAVLTGPDCQQLQRRPARAAAAPSGSTLRAHVQDVLRYTLGVADPARTDRLFPAGPAVSNPLSLDHGAVGVAHVLRQVMGAVPAWVLDWILAQDLRRDTYVPGLYGGLSGVAWGLAELGLTERAGQALDLAEQHALLYDRADLYAGCAGHGLTQLRFWHATGRQHHLDRALAVAQVLTRTRQVRPEGDCWPFSPDFMRIGYGFGASGVALFWLHLFVATGDREHLQAGERALAFDVAFGRDTFEPGVLSFPEDTQNLGTASPYWRQGSAGVGTVALRYWQVTGEERWRALALQLLTDVNRRYTLFPGLFQGLAGLGQYALDVHRVLGHAPALDAAHGIADSVRRLAMPRAGGVAYPGDYLHRISTDFGTGSAGIALFLHRLATGGPNLNFTLDEALPGPVRASPVALAAR